MEFNRTDLGEWTPEITYEVKTDKVPPLLSKVWVILVPQKKG